MRIVIICQVLLLIGAWIMHPIALAGIITVANAAGIAHAVEYPIGKPQQRYGMEITAVYLQPLPMEPDGMMKKPQDADVHMEADIKALASNANGFPEDAWIPYLTVKYEITKQGSSEKSAAFSCRW